MNRQRTPLILLLILALMLALSACTTAETPATAEEMTEEAAEEAFSVTVVDGMGSEVTLDAKPQRIASMTLGTDEILMDLVGPERLVAVTYLSADPSVSNIANRPELAEVETTLDVAPSPEQILALEPDLVFLATFTDSAIIDQLRDAGLNVFVVGFFNSVDAMEQNILTISELVGEAETGEAIVADMNDRLAAVDEALAGVEEMPSVLNLSTDGWVAGSGTTVDDIITRAGGVNAAAELADWQQISEEALIEMDPDAVLLSAYVLDSEFVDNPAYSGMSAVQNDRVFTISDAYISTTSQYIVRGVEVLANELHPDLVPAPEYLPEG